MWSITESRFAARWVGRVTVGEAAGFALATTVAVSVVLASPSPATGLLLTVAGGIAEGTVLAVAQFSAMQANRPARLPWIAATATGAGVAWTLGMLPSTVGLDPAAPATWVLLGAGGVVLLASIPVAQALVLRRRGSVRWAAGNMAAWAVAVLWTLAPSPFIDEHSPVALVAVLYGVAGLLMAVTIALLTAPLAIRLFAVPSAVARPSAPVGSEHRGLGAPLHAELRE